MRATWLIGLAGCGVLPNTAPVLDTFNGVAIDDLFQNLGGDEVRVEEGVDFDIEFTFHDPQGDDVRIWIAVPPPGLELDEVTGIGVWRDPDGDAAQRGLEVVLEDLDPKEPRYQTYYVPLGWGWGGGGGGTY